MISADFAPNESFSDVVASIATLLRPWQWRKGKALFKVKQKLKRLFGSDFEVALFLTGRAALYRLFQSIDLDKGAEVAVQGFTCEAVVLPLIQLQLKPVYVDIEKESYSMSIEDLEKKLTPQTKALILQHTFGMIPEDRKKILEYAKKRGVIVIEDLAHGFNNSLFKKTSTEPQSDFLLLSFGRTKTISSVFGGAILTKNKDTFLPLREYEKTNNFPSMLFITAALWYKPLSWVFKKTYDLGIGKILHYLTNSLQILPREISFKEKRGEFDPLYIKAYPNALARLLLKQIKQIEQINRKRLIATKKYKMHFLKSSPIFELEPIIRFPLEVNDPEAVLKAAKRKRVYIGRWYDKVIAPKEIPLNKLLYKTGICPVAESVCKRIINLPTTVSDKQAERVLDAVVYEAS